MKIKYKGFQAEANAEEVAERIIESNERTWKEKFNSKNKAKKEFTEIKHKNKMEKQLVKMMDDAELKQYYKKKLNVKDKDTDIDKSNKIYAILNVIMFFIYGLFCILGFQNNHTISAIISLIQTLLVFISFLISMNFFQFFKNDYKLFFIISVFLILPWLMFSV